MGSVMMGIACLLCETKQAWLNDSQRQPQPQGPNDNDEADHRRRRAGTRIRRSQLVGPS